MLAVLRQRNFSLLWFGGVLSVIGDHFLFVALPFFAYERTASTLATGAMFVAVTLPRVLFSWDIPPSYVQPRRAPSGGRARRVCGRHDGGLVRRRAEPVAEVGARQRKPDPVGTR
jgi:hypothetical protein